MLEEGVSRIDGRIRSRLSLARHAALETLGAPVSAVHRNRAFVPAGIAAAATVAFVALIAWQQKSPHAPVNEGAQSSFEDLELLADSEAFELIEDDGAFYEWAAAEDDSSG